MSDEKYQKALRYFPSLGGVFESYVDEDGEVFIWSEKLYESRTTRSIYFSSLTVSGAVYPLTIYVAITKREKGYYRWLEAWESAPILATNLHKILYDYEQN